MPRYGGYPKHITVAEKKAKAKKHIEKLRKKNPDISPVTIEGRKIAKTWWGEAWNKNLEKYADYSNRIERGRAYVRHGSVLDLKIKKGSISALISGSRAKPYEVEIAISPLEAAIWDTVIKECEGKIDSLQELIDGKFPKALSDLFTVKDKGIFPSPKEIGFYCSCPDGASMCKHIAAALYAIGARLDEDPKMFFELRNIKIEELISDAISKKTKTLLKKSKIKSSRVIEETDILDVFGVDVD
ncbi:MAG: hypothetical protein COA82_06760 [Alkaliphilus sp.]|nr:SWIM zinc finger family protein [bacterium AH-315-L21]MBN4056617.1 SWIM zinc finger family protein [bacterium AH-315-K05]PHS34785.1 MAG: hypothetical protein COA82_06760 [Alkaliphilus sp.]